MPLFPALSPRSNTRSQLARLLERQTERDWDLTLSFRVQRVEAMIAEPLDRFVGKLHEAIGRASRATVAVADRVPALADAARETRDHSGLLNGSANSIAAAAEEMAATLEQDLAPNTQHVARLARQVAQSTSECDHFGEHAWQRVNSIGQGVDTLADRVAALSEQADQIGQIIGLIDGIAKQTNLLALNAAIEAVRAGQHGAGFSVVADEVRQLADQTGAATRQVQALLDQVQTGVGDTVAGVDAVREDMQQGLEAVRSTRDGLRAAREATDELGDSIHQIASATEQMSSTAKSVSADIQQVAGVAARMEGKAREAGAFSDELEALASSALDAIGVFRLDIHRRARECVESLAAPFQRGELDTATLEGAMHRALAEHQFLELLYVTDASGRQVTANIAPDGFAAQYTGTGAGQDWSGREWFRCVAEDGDTYATPLYRSAATGTYCFTVAVPLRASNGTLGGVLAADISLSAIYRMPE
ncbi:methyl-accepting chemotaxis protein [Thioalkalivibrio sp. ALJ16]|uniref:methyl-accepting chemotaxis protein n=1 Tax=Thioalkalivibrio sp. ALJ16 TaxID=1158762 RepID=UPI0003768B56|nr:methyl-accepting chemotaxis protein [Thioalkalivibrio sp. ALJ16]